MTEPRRFILDTDTASDDVWAILAALRAPQLHLEAITTVCGNLPVALCTQNARLAVARAESYAVPVYEGSARPLKNTRAFYAFDCHGADGLSGWSMPLPPAAESMDAVEALLALTAAAPGEIEIACIGPLTNLARACRRDGDFPRRVKKLYILGGAAGGRGNMTEAAEYNNFVDPEAAQIVLDAPFDALWLSWSAAGGEAAVTAEELERLSRSPSAAARFAAEGIRAMADYYRAKGEALAVIDAALLLAALWPELVTERFPALCTMELGGGADYGAMRVERGAARPNALVAAALDGAAFKKKLFALLGEPI